MENCLVAPVENFPKSSAEETMDVVVAAFVDFVNNNKKTSGRVNASGCGEFSVLYPHWKTFVTGKGMAKAFCDNSKGELVYRDGDLPCSHEIVSKCYLSRKISIEPTQEVK